jgi:protein-S-isoprenylcysteine O-methyltransferase Ste14
MGKAFYTYRQYLSLALMAASLYLARPLTSNPAANRWWDALAFALVIAGGAIRSWAMGYHLWRRMKGPDGERFLVTAGPYALVRNPLYLGTLLISAGIALMSGSWIIIAIYLLVFWTGYILTILWEERRLTRQFSDQYREYFSKVPRLVPSFARWAHPEGTFSLPAMIRCMEPVKTLGFLALLVLMLWRKGGFTA